MARIVLDGITKQFPDGTTAVRSLDLDDRRRRAAGARRAVRLRQDDRAAHGGRAWRRSTDGTIFIDDRPVNDLEPRHRDIAMVFQSYALYPHLTVYDNMAFSLKYREGSRRREIRRRVAGGGAHPGAGAAAGAQAAAAVRRAAPAGGDGPGDRAPAAAFLMDEPLSNLDAKLRVQMRGRDRPAAALARRDHHLRHPRPDRGDDAGQPGRGDPARRAAAGGAAAGALPAARPTCSWPRSSARRP